MQRKPDISKAQEILGWNPKVQRGEGLKLTYDYFKSLTREDLYKKEHNTFEKYIR
jgi:dTDP-glucose 4,6-dehydratase